MLPPLLLLLLLLRLDCLAPAPPGDCLPLADRGSSALTAELRAPRLKPALPGDWLPRDD